MGEAFPQLREAAENLSGNPNVQSFAHGVSAVASGLGAVAGGGLGLGYPLPEDQPVGTNGIGTHNITRANYGTVHHDFLTKLNGRGTPSQRRHNLTQAREIEDAAALRGGGADGGLWARVRHQFANEAHDTSRANWDRYTDAILRRHGLDEASVLRRRQAEADAGH
jgi:hypothetical protein